MLPQNRLEIIEDLMFFRFLRGIDRALLHKFRLKVTDAINSVLVFSQHFDSQICKTAEDLYIEEREKLMEKKGIFCEFAPETEVEKIENRLLADIVSLVKCYKEFRSPNVAHGGKITIHCFSNKQ